MLCMLCTLPRCRLGTIWDVSPGEKKWKKVVGGRMGAGGGDVSRGRGRVRERGRERGRGREGFPASQASFPGQGGLPSACAAAVRLFRAAGRGQQACGWQGPAGLPYKVGCVEPHAEGGREAAA